MITYHEEDGNIVLKYESDAEPVIEHVKARTEYLSRFGQSADMHYKMSIPLDTLLKISQETGLDFYDKDDAKKIKQIIQRDYPKLCVRRTK